MISKLLLISDLDNTILGDTEALARFAQFFRSVKDQISLVYASGRFFASIQNDIHTTQLPEPLAVIGGVGSEIRSFPDGSLVQTWVERISANWSAERVRQVLADESQLELQPEESQSEFKVSYYLRDAPESDCERLRAKLRDAGVQVSLIYSSGRDLDFLPAGVNKGTAAEFVAQRFGFAAHRVLVAGDSGNDVKMFECPFHGIVVSNAHDELKAMANHPRVYQSSTARADGVLEGLRFWMPKLLGQNK